MCNVGTIPADYISLPQESVLELTVKFKRHSYAHKNIYLFAGCIRYIIIPIIIGTDRFTL